MSEHNDNTSIVPMEASDLRDEIVGLSEGRKDLYSSLIADTFEGKLELLAAVTDAAPVADAVNVPINLKHVIVQAVEVTNENGTVATVPRVVLLDDQGQAFYGISEGLYRSVTTYIKLLGDPNTWAQPVKIIVKRAGKAPRQYFTMTLAPKSGK